MKKLTAFILGAFAILCMAACSSSSVESLLPKDSLGIIDLEYGRVRKIVGNEMELDLADFFWGVDNGGGMEGNVGGGMTEADEEAYRANMIASGEKILYEENSADGLTSFMVVQVGSADDTEETEQTDDELIQRGFEGFDDNLDFTGETLNLVVPAGTPITNVSGSELALSSIKDNSIIGYEFAEDGETLERILVLC